MFATRPAFKNPLQLDPQRTLWKTVELIAQWPWFIATVIIDEESGARQSFILSTDKDVGAFLKEPPAPGQFIGLSIVSPPNQSPTRQWHTNSVISIERPTNPEMAHAMPLTFLCQDGTRYGGFPLEVAELGVNDVAEVLRFSREEKSL
ncbi:hypothetical protein [Roseateles toxinivorans]|uniref:Uncharacterized protein n=1 Tax=Roseateles toxinivorans TaxID=270368 RepID=A0A4R6QQD6_9BURK|nr:hypothetical protein [Roseateles toxinivorans]TDP73120.1 hypothetical protein DES47_102866 [Roseateles toxinivorans]